VPGTVKEIYRLWEMWEHLLRYNFIESGHDAQMTGTWISGAQGPWDCSENESTDRL
jgi:hypothetical protein